MLDTGDISPLLTKLTGRKRAKEIALVAIANYAKFTGRYKEFQELKQRYNLKWNQVDSIKTFERFFNPSMSLDSMVIKVRQMLHVLPEHMAEVIRYAVLTGLRPTEACESFRLLRFIKFDKPYYNAEAQTVEHFRFPELFIRQTKKAYISFLSVTMYDYFTKNLRKTPTPTLNSITLACRRRNIDMNMHLCRKIFASWLIKSGLDSNTVDLLQGRVNQSILVRHYQVPDSQLSTRVLEAVDGLQREIG